MRRWATLEPFTTTAGVKGFREVISLTAGAKNIQFVMYYFAGSAIAKIIVSCTSAAEDADHYARRFSTQRSRLLSPSRR